MKTQFIHVVSTFFSLQVLKIFGPKYLQFLAFTLESVLQRGYQVHVRIATLSHVLGGMRDRLDPPTVSSLLEKAVETVAMELFSDFSGEKKVQAILQKTPEAKKDWGYHVLQLLASASAKADLLGLLEPFLTPRPTHGAEQQGHEVLLKCRKASEAVIEGLKDNQQFSGRDRMNLAYGMLHQKLGEKWITTNRY